MEGKRHAANPRTWKIVHSHRFSFFLLFFFIYDICTYELIIVLLRLKAVCWLLSINPYVTQGFLPIPNQRRVNGGFIRFPWVVAIGGKKASTGIRNSKGQHPVLKFKVMFSGWLIKHQEQFSCQAKHLSQTRHMFCNVLHHFVNQTSRLPFSPT